MQFLHGSPSVIGGLCAGIPCEHTVASSGIVTEPTVRASLALVSGSLLQAVAVASPPASTPHRTHFAANAVVFME